jgi:hypothetical protein
VLINGARQAGKSTQTRLATADLDRAIVRLLDDPATLRAAQVEAKIFGNLPDQT